jgi:DNA-binding CsgD family transcriptional regulator
MIDLAQAPTPSQEVLCVALGLTHAEAKLAAQICSGLSLRDISAQDRRRITTLRTQLASIFAKTQTTRQAELVALIAQLSFVSHTPACSARKLRRL